MSRYLVPNLVKACEILERLSDAAAGLTVSDVARGLSMPRTTAYRILLTLVHCGMAVEEDGRYRIGPASIRLGHQSLGGADLRTKAVPVLQHLVETTQETAHLIVPSGDRCLILEVCDSPHVVRVASRPGTLAAMHCSAPGKALLAAMPRDEALALLRRTGLPRRTRRTIVRSKRMARELDQIEARGYAVDNEEYHDGVRCVAAPVFNVADNLVGAIGITAVAARLPDSRTSAAAKCVASAARRLSEALGWRGGIEGRAGKEKRHAPAR